jgi:hypothetical protein
MTNDTRGSFPVGTELAEEGPCAALLGYPHRRKNRGRETGIPLPTGRSAFYEIVLLSTSRWDGWKPQE